MSSPRSPARRSSMSANVRVSCRPSSPTAGISAHAVGPQGDGPLADRVMSQLLRRLVILQPGEAPVLLASFATLLCMFSSYTILRPVRDALGITSGLETIPYLFWGVFVAMLLLQPVYGWLPSRFPRSVFLPWAFGVF